ncbi:MAG: SUMF1/EgtB/PvdO family nonheme iron enzyme [Verrucomicrobiales bacterium]|nr:SUMF1/EgtB/PvdO family nonheme iron enzyme [Verrucomicrobiales bacterium]
MKNFLLSPLCLALCLSAVFSFARAERVALIVGVDSYASDTIPSLDGALRDARIMSKTLKEMHSPFDVILLEDPTLNDALDGIDEFMSKARGAQCALFFFAGHGIEYHGENFLLTSDSDIGLDSETSVEATKRRLRRKMLSLNLVMDEIELTGSDLKLLVLDACRDNPIPSAGSGGKTRSLGSTRGLARVSAPLGMLVSYSADAGQVANDGLFTEILTSNLAEPSLSVMEVFAKTREEVNAVSRERNEADSRYNVQLPAEYNKLGLSGIKFVFNDPNANATTMPPPVPAPNPTVPTVPPKGNTSRSLPAETFLNSVEIKMIPLAGGRFQMGDLDGRGEADELPVREVEIAPFHLASTEVTQKAWGYHSDLSIQDLRREAGFLGQKLSGEGPGHPVYYVSYDKAVEYCRKLTTAEQHLGRIPPGYAYRLPTEAEWEYACRAGATESFQGDAMEIGEIAGYNGSIESGTKRANAFGLYDMQGNVWEWCHDYYQAGYRGLSGSFPRGPVNGESRVFRGGSWMEEQTASRPSARGYALPGFKHRSVGFRLALGKE